ncbi:MAG: excinuclease ABC subunit UvrC [Cytophagales bacterium]|nr:excinuclease ABC subunit UvrC [Cytophagales bacterium]
MINLKKTNLPTSPGVYKFLNKDSGIIYVGKSKNLKKRVTSYFRKNVENKKIKRMVKEVSKIEFVLSESEHDALLLENNLIKEDKPKYNILLRDDKTYPWICIKNERFPRVFLTRKHIKDGSEYFGPFTSVKTINTLLNIINNIYPVRVSNYNFSEKKINNTKNRIGLNIHSKNGHILILGFQEYSKKKKDLLSEDEYNKNIKYVREILNGNFKNVKEYLSKKMTKYSSNLEFEKSQSIKEKLEILDRYQSKSIVVNNKIKNLDIIGIIDDEKSYFINFMKINNGIINSSKTFKTKKTLDNLSEIRQIIFNLRSKNNTLNNKLISNIDLKKHIENKNDFQIPRSGDKKKLIDMSLRNVLFFKKNLYNEKKERKTKKISILVDLKNKLNLKNIPFHIECFDVSNIQGKNTVASLVMFKDGYPSKKSYRKFKIRSVNKPDDFESMREVIFRRYSRILKEKGSLPDLIIVDGGKGQLSSACDVIKELNIYNKMNIIGIAKKLEEIYFPNDSIPVLLSKKSAHLKLIQNIRNEAHRFAITYHKQLRSNTFLKSELEQINGIGEKTRIKLIKKFKSFDNIKKQNKDNLIKLVGAKRADTLLKYLKINTPKD